MLINKRCVLKNKNQVVLDFSVTVTQENFESVSKF